MDSEALIKKQCSIKASMERAMSNYKKCPKDRMTREYIEVRLENLERDWLLFRNNHMKLIEQSEPEEVEEHEYKINNIYETIEELYFDYKSLMKAKLNQLPQERSIETPKTESNSCVKLPTIVIPKFSGNYADWPTFRDLFLSLIHRNNSIDNVQKLQYLKGHVAGEAEQLLRQYQVTESNYTVCWALLERRYNNKKYLCNSILSRLFSLRRLNVESGCGLKQIYDTTNDCLSALKNLDVDVSTWDVILIHMIAFKLDPVTRREWELKVENDSSVELPTYDQFKQFLEARFRALENLERKTSNFKGNDSSNQAHSRVHLGIDDGPLNCEYCSERHKLCFCKAFAKLSYDQRHDFVTKNRMCYNCLAGTHMIKNCNKPTSCRICRRRHHSLLHPKSPNPSAHDHNRESQNQGDGAGATSTDNNDRTLVAYDENGPPEKIVTCFSSGDTEQKHILLATALINAQSKSGDFQVIRALLDQGSQASFVTEDVVQLLRLKKQPAKGIISGLGSDKTIMSKSMVTIVVQSLTEPDFKLEIKPYVLKNITSYLPNRKVNSMKWVELKGMRLADPEYDSPNKIDILLGADVYSRILKDGVKRAPSETAIAQNTTLGWILSGVVTSKETLEQSDHITVTHAHHVHEDEILKRFWEIEEQLDTEERFLTEEEQRCEKFYSDTTKRREDGRYVVKLPFREDKTLCIGGSSREIAVKRLKGLERKFTQDVKLKEEYTEVINEYLRLDHMQPVKENHEKREAAVYLPHHAVIREDKTTSKVRVVFDASCKNSTGVSLNDELMIGPTLQPDLRHIILRWRFHPIALVADIVKMYRQVRIAEEDQSFQRIVWRDNPDSQIQDYELLTVTFGTASAPYLAVRSLQQVAYDEGNHFPLVKAKVLESFYMDDLLTGCQSTEEGVELYKQISEMLKRGGFDLQKWNSNDKQLLKEISENKPRERTMTEKEEERRVEIKLEPTVKILGLTWDRDDDELKYSVKLPERTGPETKRTVISDIARLFDPLGWIAPSIIIAKTFIQKLWLSGINWDEELPTELLKEWLTYRTQLVQLTKFRIPRWLRTETDKTVELHGFSDASKMAYSAVVYVRTINCDGIVHVSLLTAKTKVAPIKQRSIPRLELCGAWLLTQLLMEMARVLNIPKENLHAWTDSTIVLAWLNKHPSHWKTFVANRVSDILTRLDACQWSHVPTKENPADCASRGVLPTDLAENILWLNGPRLLKQNTVIYLKPKELKTELEQSVKSYVGAVEKESDYWSKFSSLKKLLKIIAYCRRLLTYRKGVKRPRHLTKVELDEALNCVIRQYQRQEFILETLELQEKACVTSKDSKIKSLSPYLDDQSVMRVGGRLQGSLLEENTKHPIILAHDSHLTKLMVADAHEKTMHGGSQLMMTYLRTGYWIVGVRRLVKKHIRNCITCVKNRAELKNQYMGSLPSMRVTPARAFYNSGVDYAGPINIRTSKGRGHKSYKGYICLFVCMATRAIHLEVVSDMTTPGFIAAFRRFVARRGHCSRLWSDNGTNFVGAAKELQHLVDIQPAIIEYLETNGTEWHFIPPHAPNFGGLWEAGVKSTKFHLKRVIGDTTLTFEEMSTLLSQVEACLNSRPMTFVNSEDPGEPEPLTPGHFLIGEPLVAVPDANYEASSMNSLNRWQMVQKMVQTFWRRWSQEYLTTLIHRYKWQFQVPEPKLGDVVLIKEDGLPPSRWLLGRIVEMHPGSDNITRVVTVKTKTSVIKRPTSKLCILPVTD